MFKKLTLLLFIIANLQASDKMDCILSNIIDNINIEVGSRIKLQQYYNEIDFNTQVDINEKKLSDLLQVKDFRTKHLLEKLLIEFKNLEPELQKAIMACNLPKLNTKKRCEKLYPKTKCEKIDEFSYAKKCPVNYSSIGYSHCVPNCPVGYDTIKDDPFHCSKQKTSKRSSEIEKSNKQPKKSYRYLIDIESCPEGYMELELDICIKKCPEGWEDFGTVCKKPLVIRRDHEIFYYQFDYDGEN